MGLPRAILAVENTGIDRLGSQAGSVSMRAAAEVYKALGIADRIGFTQAQAPAHCSFPSVQTPGRPSLREQVPARQNGRQHGRRRDAYETDLTKWVTWSTPTLN